MKDYITALGTVLALVEVPKELADMAEREGELVIEIEAVHSKQQGPRYGSWWARIIRDYERFIEDAKKELLGGTGQ